jgi:hypothetical protein
MLRRGHRSLGRSAGLFGMYLIDMLKLSKRGDMALIYFPQKWENISHGRRLPCLVTRPAMGCFLKLEGGCETVSDSSYACHRGCSKGNAAHARSPLFSPVHCINYLGRSNGTHSTRPCATRVGFHSTGRARFQMEPSFEKDVIKGTRDARSITEIKDLIDLYFQVAAQLQIHFAHCTSPL